MLKITRTIPLLLLLYSVISKSMFRPEETRVIEAYTALGVEPAQERAYLVKQGILKADLNETQQQEAEKIVLPFLHYRILGFKREDALNALEQPPTRQQLQQAHATRLFPWQAEEQTILDHQIISMIHEAHEYFIEHLPQPSANVTFSNQGTANHLPALSEQPALQEMTDPCAICQDSMDNQSWFSKKRLWCTHVYHRDCINSWLKTSPTCPVCRADHKRINNLIIIGTIAAVGYSWPFIMVGCKKLIARKKQPSTQQEVAA